jgi:hypothetical protein
MFRVDYAGRQKCFASVSSTGLLTTVFAQPGAARHPETGTAQWQD